MSLQDFEAEVRRVSPDPDGWETLGVGAICLTPEVWEKLDAGRLAGYMFVGGTSADVYLLWSDTTVTGWNKSDGKDNRDIEVREDVIRTARRAHEQGLPMLPQELLEFMEINESDFRAPAH